MSETQIPRLVPAPGRLVVEALEETMWGGLFLPVKTQEKPMMGRITALPPEYPGYFRTEDAYREEGETYYQVGDTVVFGQNSGMQVDIGAGVSRRRAIILREQDVLAKVVYDEQAGLKPLPFEPPAQYPSFEYADEERIVGLSPQHTAPYGESGVRQDFNGELLPADYGDGGGQDD